MFNKKRVSVDYNVIRIVLVVLQIFLLTGCDQSVPVQKEAEQKIREEGVIVAVGDSLTAGLGVPDVQNYPARLAKLLAEAGVDYQVVNSGISGETSSGTLSRISWVLKMDPDIVILETGANDGLRGIDPKLVKENIENSIKILLEHNVSVVLVGMKMVANLGHDYLKVFNAIYPDIANRYPVTFMPFFLEGVATEPNLNQPDGIHPTGDGYRIIADNLLPYVEKAIRENQRQGKN